MEENPEPLIDAELALDIETRAITLVGKYCLETTELVEQFNRLYSRNLLKSTRRAPIEKMIDNACGVDGENPDDWRCWSRFVIQCVWLPLPEEAKDDFRTRALAELFEEAMAEEPEAPL